MVYPARRVAGHRARHGGSGHPEVPVRRKAVRTPYKALDRGEMARKIAPTNRPQDRPETRSQAHTWDRVKTHYEKAGLCGACAAQAAYGHQLGFHKINPPCDHCSYVVLPVDLLKVHGIRGQRWLHGDFTRGGSG